MKALRFSIVVLAFFTGSLFASAVENSIKINQFGGMATDIDPLSLGDGYARDSENVITDLGSGIQPRNGYIKYSTEPAKAMWIFAKSDGTRYVIAHSSDTLKADSGAKNFSILVSSVAPSIITAGAQLGDYFYFCNTVDGLKRWDGSAVSVASAPMTMDQLVTWKGRLAGSGKPGAGRTIFLSRFLNGSDWTLETDPTDDGPSQITVGGALDENISGLYASYKDLLMWFKNNSFGGLYGSRRSNFILRTYSESVGTNHPGTVRDCDGYLRFLGPRRTVWEFNGTDLTKISEGNNALFNGILNGEINTRSTTITSKNHYEAGTLRGLSTTISEGSILLSTWTATDTTADDFAAGTLTNVTTQTVSGNIYVTPQSALLDDFTDGDFTSNPAWSVASEAASPRWSVSGNRLVYNDDAGLYKATLYTPSTRIFGEWAILFSTGSDVITTYQPEIILFATSFGTGANAYDPLNGYGVRFRSFGISIYRYATTSGGARTTIGSASGSYSINNSTLSVSRDWTGVIRAYINGTLVATSSADTTFTSGVFTGILESVGDDAAIDNVYFPVQTHSGTFVSTEYDTGMSSPRWLPSSFTANTGGGSVSAYTQSSADSVVWEASAPWTSGTGPTSSAQRHVRYQFDFVAPSSATSGPFVSDVTLSARQSSGTFVSDTKALGSGISTWNVFQADETLNDGAITYGFYTDTDTVKTIGGDGLPVVGTFVSSQTITNNTIPSVSTSAYSFMSAKFAITLSTQAPSNDRLSVSWQEGSGLKAKGLWINQRYWLATTLGSLSSNDTVFVFDRRRHWQRYTGLTVDSIVLHESYPLFSNPLGIWQGETGTSDSGSSIHSYYTTKYYWPVGPETKAYLRELWMTTTRSDSVLRSYLYFDGLDVPGVLGWYNMNGFRGYTVKKIPIPTSNLQSVRHMSLRWDVEGTDTWRIINGSIYFDPDTQRE